MRLNKKQKLEFKENALRVLAFIEERNYKYSMTFLCIDIFDSKKEGDPIYQWFLTQRPTTRMNKEFYKSPVYSKWGNCWWRTNEEGNKQRALFIKHLIKKLKV